ncbi:MAG: hypothetical protein ACI4FX_02905 [Agathobacter sp.]
MYSETIENYKRQIWVESNEIEKQIKQELDIPELRSSEDLKQCLSLISALRSALFNASGYLETFMIEEKTEEQEQETIEWAQNTLKSLCKFEYLLLAIHKKYTHDPDAAGKIIPVSVEREPGMIIIDIDTDMPHKKDTCSKSSSMLSFLLDESFRVQLGEPEYDEKFERAFVFIEHHVNRDIPKRLERDCDNYDSKHLIDLAADYFLKYGDGPDYVRYGEAVLKDDHSFTRIRLVKPENLIDFLLKNEGFFQCDKVVTN